MYQYITIFMSTAEKAKNWLQDHADTVTVSIENNLYILDYKCDVNTYNNFINYMQFIR